MKKLSIILFILLGLFFDGNATHLVGGTMNYTYLGRDGGSNNFKYRIRYTVYRDCENGEAEYDPRILVCVYSEASKKLVENTWISLKNVVKVDPVGKTDCPQIRNICLERGIYEKEISLPSSNYGYILKWERCCRNQQVNLPDDISNKPKFGQTYIGYIPRTSYANSSPYFTDVPVPYICLNDTTEIRNYAIDPDGDSLVYSFIHPFAGASQTNPNGQDNQSCSDNFSLQQVSYNNGYNVNQPFGASGFANIHPTNGLTTYMSRKKGNFAVAVRVTEYRNGFRLSETILDLQIYVFECPPNNKPDIVAAPDTLYVEGGAKLCRVFRATDKDVGDKVTIKAFGDMFSGANGFKGTKATFTKVTGINNVKSEFCWDTDCDQVRDQPYIFTLEAIDDGCPPKFRNKNIYVKVLPFVSKIKLTGDTVICENEAAYYELTGGNPGSIYTWEVENGVIEEGRGKSKVKIKWSDKPGKITVREINVNGCVGNNVYANITFYPKVPTPKFNGKDTVCYRNIEKYIADNMPNIGNYYWIVDGGLIIGARNNREVTINWNREGIGSVKLVQESVEGCTSDTTSLDVLVLRLTAPEIKGPNSICPNNEEDFRVDPADPQSSYQWFYNNQFLPNYTSSTVSVLFGNPAIDILKVVEVNRFGCKSDTGYFSVKVDYKLEGDNPKGDTSLCLNSYGEEYFVERSKNSTYVWKSVLGTIVGRNDSNLVVTDWTTVGNGSVTVTEFGYDSVNRIICKSEDRTLDVVVHPNPNTQGIYGDFDVCQNEFAKGNYRVNGFANSTFNWTFNGDGARVENQGSDDIMYPFDITDTFNIRVVETTEFGCVDEPLDTLLFIRPKPTANSIVGEATVCFPDITNKVYTVNGFAGSTYEWWVEGGEFVSVDSNRVVVNWFDNKIGELKVLETSQFGCVGDTVVLDIWVDHPSIDLDVVSVAFPPAKDNSMLVRWRLINGDRYNSSFEIQRRIAGSTSPFTTVGTVDGSQRMFVETQLNTDSNAFEYRVKGLDLCGNELLSEVHTSVLLTGSQDGPYATSLNFTEYKGWDNGVSIYEFYRMLPEKTPYEFYSLPTEKRQAYFENGLDYYTQCYRVKATELDGQEEVSWSNEVCFNFEPVVFVPNAFTPNDKGPNDYYFVVGGSMKTLKLSIYNRWGEKLFESTELSVGWDGTFKGKRVDQGVYMYVLEYTSFDDTLYRQKGTVTLLR